jgi:hypothetical protein
LRLTGDFANLESPRRAVPPFRGLPFILGSDQEGFRDVQMSACPSFALLLCSCLPDDADGPRAGVYRGNHQRQDEEESGAASKATLRHSVSTEQAVDVYLARGKLDSANKLAESRLWSRNLENLETMTPFANPHDDAYRLYNIGVAYEALGYQSEDRSAAKKFLEQASIYYGKPSMESPTRSFSWNLRTASKPRSHTTRNFRNARLVWLRRSSTPATQVPR